MVLIIYQVVSTLNTFQFNYNGPVCRIKNLTVIVFQLQVQ
jgi:hypothetical protein